MPDSTRTRPAAYLPDEMEDVQPPPKRHLPNPKSTSKEQGRSKKWHQIQVGKAHSLTGHNTEREKKKQGYNTHSERRGKSQSARGLSSDFEPVAPSGSKLDESRSEENAEDFEIELVGGPQSTKPAAPLRARVEEHIDVMQEGQANLHDRVAQLEKKVEFYKNLSEERLNDIVQWIGNNAPRPPWALPPASGSATKTIKTENVKTEGDNFHLTAPKRSRKKKRDNPTVKSLDEVDLANDLLVSYGAGRMCGSDYKEAKEARGGESDVALETMAELQSRLTPESQGYFR